MKILLSSLILITLTLGNQDSVDSILQNIDNRVQPSFISAELLLKYNDKNGDNIDERQLYYRREWQSIESESILIKFMSPDEIKNSSFLSITGKGNSKQLFYLPDLGNPMQIKSNKLNSSFMNSDFYFGDIKSWRMAENKNRLIDETKNAFLVESIFQKAWFNQRLIISVDKKTWLIERVEYFAKGCNYPVRIMQIKEKKEVDGFVIPVHIEMTTYRECSQIIKSSSEIIYTKLDIDSKINPELFTQEFMSYHEF